MVIDEGRGAHPASRRGSDVYNDEISLFDLTLMLWRNKMVGLTVAVVVMVMTLGYLLIATPIYKADVHFMPPTRQNIEALNVARQYNLLNEGDVGAVVKQYGMLGYDLDQVYQEFIRRLNSLALRREFFNRNNLLDHYAADNEEINENVVFNRAFNEKLAVSSPGRQEDSPFWVISFEMDVAEKAASLLNRFVEFVAGETKEQLIGNVRNSIAAEIGKLETLIESKRSVAEQRRQDTIAQLQEALQVARKLNIQKISDYSRAYEGHSQPADSDPIAVNTVELPLYTRGTLALEAEIEALKDRKSDDPYIDGLRDAQERLNTLRALAIDPKTVKVVTIDNPAVIPVRPEKPKKVLVLAVGICLALLLGVMAALFAEFVKGLHRQFKSAKAEG